MLRTEQLGHENAGYLRHLSRTSQCEVSSQFALLSSQMDEPDCQLLSFNAHFRSVMSKTESTVQIVRAGIEQELLNGGRWQCCPPIACAWLNLPRRNYGPTLASIFSVADIYKHVPSLQ